MGAKWDQNKAFFGVWSSMKVPPVSRSIVQKEQNCVGPSKFYCSIAPMLWPPAPIGLME